ncbi:transcription elongation factor GreAB [Pseudalgibacter alginicilyticus]|uniref:Transcription elongation factor GreAB n=1 Tax=Pseudalgibacter alginicilyticus TaxID=1736674 RepID=A0A0P0D9X6_9FLAO|nr:GreA/GreB family elongation factor [Pseudalgibacter alginicilyticus]ALJ04757.1 transcription elongation factor GreAB [Pseudalgibacter alginicilyticus]
MKYGSIILEKKEYVYIKRILNISGYVGNHEIQKSLIKFTEELKTAHILDEKEFPVDVVRLNSIVTVSSGENWKKTIQIVQPSEKDIKNNKISILTPMGAALFGYSVNDIVKWDFPTGIKELKIIEVTQQAKEKILLY